MFPTFPSLVSVTENNTPKTEHLPWEWARSQAAGHQMHMSPKTCHTLWHFTRQGKGERAKAKGKGQANQPPYPLRSCHMVSLYRWLSNTRNPTTTRAGPLTRYLTVGHIVTQHTPGHLGNQWWLPMPCTRSLLLSSIPFPCSLSRCFASSCAVLSCSRLLPELVIMAVKALAMFQLFINRRARWPWHNTNRQRQSVKDLWIIMKQPWYPHSHDLILDLNFHLLCSWHIDLCLLYCNYDPLGTYCLYKKNLLFDCCVLRFTWSHLQSTCFTYNVLSL